LAATPTVKLVLAPMEFWRRMFKPVVKALGDVDQTDGVNVKHLQSRQDNWPSLMGSPVRAEDVAQADGRSTQQIRLNGEDYSGRGRCS